MLWRKNTSQCIVDCTTTHTERGRLKNFRSAIFAQTDARVPYIIHVLYVQSTSKLYFQWKVFAKVWNFVCWNLYLSLAKHINILYLCHLTEMLTLNKKKLPTKVAFMLCIVCSFNNQTVFHKVFAKVCYCVCWNYCGWLSTKNLPVFIFTHFLYNTKS